MKKYHGNFLRDDFNWKIQQLLDLFPEGVLVVDKYCKIRYLNKPYAEFLGVERNRTIGENVERVIPSTELKSVLESGRPQIGFKHTFQDGREVISNRLPIIDGGKVVGVMGYVVLRSKSELDKMAMAFGILKEKVHQSERRIDKYIRAAQYSFDDIVAEDDEIIATKSRAIKAARSLSTVLIEGESGTGKELFAHAIHRASARAKGPFIRLNCAAIPYELIEAELFGYAKGAFTGAKISGNPGKFELADQGTIFLDEIGDIPLGMQSKLLRVLEDREITRLGDTVTRKVDFACITATNRNLEEMTSAGDFRMDLFFRINVVHVQLPPLRNLKQTLLAMTRRIVTKNAILSGTDAPKISPEVKEILLSYAWPGNVRELKNVFNGAVSMCDGKTVTISDMPKRFWKRNSSFKMSQRNYKGNLKDIMQKIEAEVIVDALGNTGYNVTESAKRLGIHRTWLYEKIKKYGIDITKDRQSKAAKTG